MAPIKFEENLKDKLEKRTLSPSPESWYNLSDRLEAQENKSKNPIFWWLSIAAGIIIMIAVSAHFFKSINSENTVPEMVEEDSNMEQLEDKKPKIDDTKLLQIAIEDQTETETKNPVINKEPQIIDYKKEMVQSPKLETKLAKLSDSNTNIKTANKEDLIHKEAQNLLNEALMKSAVADALKQLKSENSAVTEREIDSLLKLASKELFKDKLQSEILKTVDANALLRSVEEEMGQSFRSKVFEALQDSYETVKTAVANRNN